ncbi:unnamed protein product [Ilex paraguariensis]|uniref:Protein kinase domain-containing protein n=1 Tax=Ilex paraguariensis TaxID=185542 RepID=A0ABC8R1R7_9AQUA
MDCISIRVISVMFLFLFFSTVNAEKEEVKQALVEFMGKLYPGNVLRDANWGWNSTSDPCTDKWQGVTCDGGLQSVKKIVLDQLNLTGVLDASSVCEARSLAVLSLNNNKVAGNIAEQISNCISLTHLYLSGNRLSGKLPGSLSGLNNLKRIDISNNQFYDELADMSKISGLLTFLAQNNELNGTIPNFDFSNLVEFNVSNNNFSGPIPDVKGHFNSSSFLGNPGLCGKPLSTVCPSAPPDKKKGSSNYKYFMYSGYAILVLIFVLFFAYKVSKRNKPNDERTNAVKKGVKSDNSSNKNSGISSDLKTEGYRSEYSITSAEGGTASSPLIVLSSPLVNELKFEDLLRSPAEIVGRGKHGSLYKVMLDSGVTLVVKRIKDWTIPRDELETRMQRLNQVKHPNVMPVVAYYCSKQEKLLVYEYQENGSLFRLLHGSQNGQLFDWGSRLSIAASIAEALSFMHKELCDDGIVHGNLKTSNILLKKDMDVCISEYGLKVVENQDQSLLAQASSIENNDTTSGHGDDSTFKVDIYGFGIILLELLTGKSVQSNGFDLAQWVQSVVREEWTVEVFDRALISEGASEERMVNLLLVALNCINRSPDARPTIDQVAVMINSIKEEEERSISSDQ